MKFVLLIAATLAADLNGAFTDLKDARASVVTTTETLNTEHADSVKRQEGFEADIVAKTGEIKAATTKRNGLQQEL